MKKKSTSTTKAAAKRKGTDKKISKAKQKTADACDDTLCNEPTDEHLWPKKTRKDPAFEERQWLFDRYLRDKEHWDLHDACATLLPPQELILRSILAKGHLRRKGTPDPLRDPDGDIVEAMEDAILSRGLHVSEVNGKTRVKASNFVKEAIAAKLDEFMLPEMRSLAPEDEDKFADARRAKGEETIRRYRDYVSVWKKKMSGKSTPYRTQAARETAKEFESPEGKSINLSTVIRAVKDAGDWDWDT